MHSVTRTLCSKGQITSKIKVWDEGQITSKIKVWDAYTVAFITRVTFVS